jgi:hypothetical protein
MPPLPSVAGAIRSDILWTDDADQNVMTRLHFAYTGGAPSDADCLALATDLYAKAAQFFLPELSPSSGLRGVDVIDLSDETAKTGTYLATTPGTSAGAGTLPGGVAALVNYQIARRYRGGKPRSYLPLGTGADVQANGMWTTGFKSSTEDALGRFFDQVSAMVAGETALHAPINISYYQGYDTPRTRSNGHLFYPPKPRDVPLVDTIIGWHLNQKPSSQRRRNLH